MNGALVRMLCLMSGHLQKTDERIKALKDLSPEQVELLDEFQAAMKNLMIPWRKLWDISVEYPPDRPVSTDPTQNGGHR